MNSRNGKADKWPKVRAILTEDQQRIQEDWYAYWLGVMPTTFGVVDSLGHSYACKSFSPGAKTLEIGCGTGGHLRFERLDEQEYVALELRPDLADAIRMRYPSVRVVIADIEKRSDLPDSHFDRVLAIHVLEHLANLPAALDEVRRVLKPGGLFSVVIPCEGGLAYHIGRKFSTQRIFEKRYHTSYDWMISQDHVSQAHEVIHELKSRFAIQHQGWYPFLVPSTHLNVIIGLTMINRLPTAGVPLGDR